MVHKKSVLSSSLFFGLFFAVVLFPVANPPSGIVGEKVARNSEAEKAGLKAGDVVLSWTRGDKNGAIESPFSLSQAEIEQQPIGSVVISGLRNGEQIHWTMGPGSWGIEARPNLPDQLLTAYREGQHLAEGGKAKEAALRWEDAAAMAETDFPAAASWFLSKAAGLLAGSGLWKEADSTYEKAVRNAANANLSVRVQLLRAWGLSYQQRRSWADAEKYFNQALALCEQSSSQDLNVATLLNDLGNVARTRGDIAGAEKNYQKALAILQQLAPDSRMAAANLHGLGWVAFERGDVAEAEKYYLQALAIREKLVPQSLELAGTLNNLGNVTQEKGELDRAEEYQRRSLEIKQALVPDSLAVATTLNNLGIIEYNRGDLQSAEQYQRKALEIRERLAPEGPDLINSFGNLGQLAEARDDLSTAKNFYRRAQVIAEKLAPGSLDLARIYESVANVAFHELNFSEAESFYRQAFTIKQERAPGGLDMAFTLHNLGSLFAKTRRYAKAEDYYLQSLAITQKLAPNSTLVTQSFLDLGELASVRRMTASATEYFLKARAITERIAPQSSAHADALAGLATQMRRQRQFQDSLRLYQGALDALESQLAHLGGSEQVRAEFRAKRAEYYRDFIDLLMQQGKVRAAFQIFERLRGRSLLEMLAEAHLDLRSGVDAKLVARERSLGQALSRLSNRRIQLLTEAKEDAQVAVLQKEIDNALIQYQEVRNEIRRSSPRYADLTQPRPLGVSEVQQLLDSDTLLLEYSLGAQRSYLWAITSNQLTTFTLPKRAVIEQLARGFYKLVSARGSVPNERAAQLQSTATALSNTVLGPATKKLARKRLVIVSDGALQYIPFAALPVPNSSQASAQREPLVVQHEIISLPSASVLAALREEGAEPRSNTRTVSVIADPVFDREDGRVRAADGSKPVRPRLTSTQSSSLGVELLTRSAADAGLLRGKELLLPRLPFSRREALAIMSVTPSGQGRAALDFEASRLTAMSQELKQYRIVHFATHGLVDSERPAFSGLVLSLVDRDGNAQDGFLSLQDIYNLDLPVELVVLSACETALGKEVDGEGLLGLTRGFMHAGAPRVMASLWNINDVATAELMAKFYAAVEGKHMRFAAALR